MFGLPAGPFAVGLAVALLLAVGVITVLAARNVVFLRMGLRNIPRRRARSALIILGLMLGTTIISAALLTGDTLATAVRSVVVESLGVTDETVTAGTDAESAVDVGLDTARPYFDADEAVAAVDGVASSLPVDGVAAAIIEPVAAQHEAGGRTEPRVTLFAPDAARAAQFGLAEVADLAPGTVLLNDDAADELAAKPGDTIVVLAGDQVLEVEVAGVGSYRGTTTDGPAVLLPLAAARDLLDRPGQANHVLVSNTGGETGGVEATDTVEPALDEAVAGLGLSAQPAKQDGLEAADETGNAFVQLFTTFGSFSMAAGILLIFLIFVMLAAERRPEMGMARAVGTQRGHLVQTFLYEGAAYDLLAAAVGAVLGIGVSFVMVQVVGQAFAAEGGLDLGYSLSGRSLVIGYALGVLLTLVVVTASAWRVSRLNIVSAIRDLPESDDVAHPVRRWVLVAIGVIFGSMLAVSGATSQVYVAWMLGVSVVIVSVVPVARIL
ncbi:MAG: ABC transporter permease, partial [Ilumatobacteraceae bacterium]